MLGIDEAQFFDEGLVDLAESIADSGVRVICAGRSPSEMARATAAITAGIPWDALKFRSEHEG